MTIAHFPQQDCRRLFAAIIARRNAFLIHFNQKSRN